MVYGLDHNGDRGEGKGAEEQEKIPVLLRSGVMAGDGAHVRVSLRSGTVLSRKVVGKAAHSPVHCSVRLTLTAAKKQRLHRDKNRQVKKAG